MSHLESSLHCSESVRIVSEAVNDGVLGGHNEGIVLRG